ncbi:hypothetical protein KUTeg_001504 [Tegillarca granosa]|uniref:Uncharacterized protein n=1 Tax=Tegillarca granosa TaxID=220873 RepID=A0ABQ9FVA7_TEGGR|nr:hypothetical protein KUTeg_001504 [Tegillarca granosa]
MPDTTKNRYLNRMEIRIDGELAMGTCIILGRKLQTICNSLEEKFARRKTYGESYETDKIISVSKLHYEKWNVSGLYIRFMAINTTLILCLCRKKRTLCNV